MRARNDHRDGCRRHRDADQPCPDACDVHPLAPSPAPPRWMPSQPPRHVRGPTDTPHGQSDVTAPAPLHASPTLETPALQELDPTTRESRPMLDELRIKGRNQGGVDPRQLQRSGLLLERLADRPARSRGGRRSRERGPVDEPPSFRRLATDHRHMLRAEQDGAQQPKPRITHGRAVIQRLCRPPHPCATPFACAPTDQPRHPGRLRHLHRGEPIGPHDPPGSCAGSRAPMPTRGCWSSPGHSLLSGRRSARPFRRAPVPRSASLGAATRRASCSTLGTAVSEGSWPQSSRIGRTTNRASS